MLRAPEVVARGAMAGVVACNRSARNLRYVERDHRDVADSSFICALFKKRRQLWLSTFFGKKKAPTVMAETELYDAPLCVGGLRC